MDQEHIYVGVKIIRLMGNDGFKCYLYLAEDIYKRSYGLKNTLVSIFCNTTLYYNKPSNKYDVYKHPVVI